MQICIVSDNLPPVYSGAGQQALTLARALKHAGHETILVGKRYGNLPAHEVLDGIDVYRVPGGTTVSPVASALQVIRLCSQLIALRNRYDVVLFFDAEGGFTHAWTILPLLHVWKKRTAARMTLLSSSDPDSLRRRRFGSVRLLPFRLHHRIISISTALSLSYLRVFGSEKRLSMIPNGVDTNRFYPASPDEKKRLRARLGLEPDLRYCAAVGRISHRKGFDIIVDAWRRVANRCSDARLLLIGPDADDRRGVSENEFVAHLRRQIAESGISGSVVWIGGTEAVEEYLRASDLFVFASRREGCPNALLEAMASGLPIISTRIEYITEDLITNGRDGVITEPDPEQLATAIIGVLDSPELADRVARNAGERVRREFSIDIVAARYAAVLASL